MTAGASSEYAGIEILGSQRFVDDARDALRLLESRAPESFAMARQHIGRIREMPRSGMNVKASPPTFDVNGATAHYSVSWFASAIAHDTYHAHLYFRHLQRRGAPVPDTVWTGVDAEREAIAHQLATLRAIDAPAHELAYAETLDGAHHDLNRDGKYTVEDYDRRSW